MTSWGKPTRKTIGRVQPLYTVDDAKHDERIANKCVRRRENFMGTRDPLKFETCGRADPVLPRRLPVEVQAQPYGAGAFEMAPHTGRSAFAKHHISDSTDGALAGPFIIGGKTARGPPPARALPPLHAAKRDNDIFNIGAAAGIAPPGGQKPAGLSHQWTANKWGHGQ